MFTLSNSSDNRGVPIWALAVLPLAFRYCEISFIGALYNATTGPVTTATNERSFSALRYLETYLRFTTKEAHLNALALLFVHRHLIFILNM